jgi:MFS family permease
MAAVFGPLSGRLVARSGPRLPLVLSGTAMLVAMLIMTRLSLHTSHMTLVITYLVFGIGFGLLNAPITNTAVSGMPRSEAGVAAAIASTSRQIGQSLGVAVIGSLVVTSTSSISPAAFPHATHVGWWVTVGCAVVVLVLGVVTTGPGARRTAERTATRLLSEVDDRQGVAA